MKELNDQIKNLNNKPSAGIDKVSNQIIKQLPLKIKEIILNLFNQSILEAKIPSNWKIAVVTMIP